MARVQAPAKKSQGFGRRSMGRSWKHMEKHHGYKYLCQFMVEFGESFTLMTNINAGFVGYNWNTILRYS
jgi:hypothetical protein